MLIFIKSNMLENSIVWIENREGLTSGTRDKSELYLTYEALLGI